MSERPPIIRVRCEQCSEDECCSSSGGEEHHLLSQLRRSTQDKRHSAPDIRISPHTSLLIRKPREKRFSGPALPPSPLTLSPGAASLYQHRASLDENYLDTTWHGRRWARLQNRRRYSETHHLDTLSAGKLYISGTWTIDRYRQCSAMNEVTACITKYYVLYQSAMYVPKV